MDTQQKSFKNLLMFYGFEKIILLLLVVGASLSVLAQQNGLPERDSASIFDKITRGISNFKPDTTAPPQDKITEKIKEMRALRGGFNIDEAIEFKLEEDRRKGEMPAGDMEALTHFFTQGAGKQKLDHAINWIYRDLFTYKELKGLVRFYKTSAGQKLATDFPLIMLQSLTAAEMLKTDFMNGLKQK